MAKDAEDATYASDHCDPTKPITLTNYEWVRSLITWARGTIPAFSGERDRRRRGRRHTPSLAVSSSA
jgi:hypothetical protein